MAPLMHVPAFAPTAGRAVEHIRFPTRQTRFTSNPFYQRHRRHVVLDAGLPKIVEKHTLRNLPGINSRAATTIGSLTGIATRPPAAVIGLAAAVLVGFVLGRVTGGVKRLSNAADEDGGNQAYADQDQYFDQEFGDPDGRQDHQDETIGVTPRWLNYAFGRMWTLFQKNTKRVISDVIQPVLDETDKPDFVTSVRLTSFKPGRQSPYLRSLRRLPSRALAEVQYSVQALFASTSIFTFEVDVNFGKVKFSIPIELENLDVDALGWARFNLAPYEPFVTGVQYALLNKPKISFDMTIGGVIPITATPILRQFFFRVITNEIPKEFLFPKSISLDFTPELIADAKGNLQMRLLVQDMGSLTKEQLHERFPEQWALFDAMDLDNGGTLSPVEVFAGLKDWGYTAEDATEGFERLDINQDDSISLSEFCQMWPTIESSFVPNKYQGVLAIFVRSAADLPTPVIGNPDPVVHLKLCGQEAKSKRDSRTSADGKPGAPIWNEAFELNCGSPLDEELEIVITDESRFVWRGPGAGREIGRATVSLASLTKRPNQQIKLKINPKGSLLLNLSYADFVDHKDATKAKVKAKAVVTRDGT